MRYKFITIQSIPTSLDEAINPNSRTNVGIRNEVRIANAALDFKVALEQIRDMATIVQSFDSIQQAEKAFEVIKLAAERALKELE